MPTGLSVSRHIKVHREKEYSQWRLLESIKMFDDQHVSAYGLHQGQIKAGNLHLIRKNMFIVVLKEDMSINEIL